MDLFYLADMTLSEVMDSVEEGVTERTLHERLGRDYKNSLFAATMSQGRGRRRMKRLDKKVTTQTSDGEYRRKIIERKAAAWGFSNDDWTPNELAKIGSVLLGAVMEATNLVEIRPDEEEKATRTSRITSSSRKKPRNCCVNTTSCSHRCLPYWRPMIYPPNDWSSRKTSVHTKPPNSAG